MTTTPKPDVEIDDGDHGVVAGDYVTNEQDPEVLALHAEAPTMALPADHPYWSVPDELRHCGRLVWDGDLERFTARGDIARRLRDEHEWTMPSPISAHIARSDSVARFVYEVRPPRRPKVTQVPAREVAKRLIDGTETQIGEPTGPVTITDFTATAPSLIVFAGATGFHFPWDSTVPVVEDGDQ